MTLFLFKKLLLVLYPIIIKESEGYTYSLKKKKTFIKHCNLTLLASSENKSKIIIKQATNQP